MAYLDQYRDQVALLVRAIPFVATENDFALKGGTAINLFVKDLPRLSVDIDLAYLPVADRATSLAAIDTAMARIADRIEKGIRGARVTPSRMRAENVITKLVVRLDNAQIKIEVTPVLRGTVYDPTETSVTSPVEDAFGFAHMQVVSLADLYAGKLVAALDRQHPRDLFDVRELLAGGGVDDALRRAFIVYAISHDRPLSEILAPTRKPLEEEFARGFDGMTREPVALDALIEAREAMIATMIADMPNAHRHFLIGFKQGEPDWSLLDVSNASTLPAVNWKMHNLGKLSAERRNALVENLRSVLFSE
ncbi:nucleotidyl transferase AbiEii/AbiGii toxin family protein [Sphingobium sp. TB-6]|uniref:nucleotidyl transferase AbiEii/AbiGii toxin family protein n=1 Tax=Sphingobium sp. TB-6 TaxID=2728850 RepID=UPI00146B3B54|nr:nucleotidyl transferase AbiEii/AbiGii toxin family protein [Sphingobium sp. TB-6]NML87725.1 nucleotidyl transferase AbiEii/AbiGii toxin family protein [Sphingobium sp. TB-6]